MNAVTTAEPVSAQTLEHVLGTGDISKLSPTQRVEYMVRTCQSVGLNPLTRPFRFLTLNGQIQMYATRDCTDQLRGIHKISLHVTEQKMDAGLVIVRVRAKAPDGREDEDIGAVTLPQSGDSRANALMKAMTKAKRRVTLSICGLGLLSEDELDTMPGVQTFDAETEVEKPSEREQFNERVPLKAAAAPMQRPPRVAEKPTPQRTNAQWTAWLDKLRYACAAAESRQEVEEIGNRPSVGDAVANGPEWIRRDVSALLAEFSAKFVDEAEPPTDDEDDLPPVEIAGADKVEAG